MRITVFTLYAIVLLSVILTNSLDKRLTIFVSKYQNLGTIATRYYLSACMSHVVVMTDRSIRVKLSLKSKSILY